MKKIISLLIASTFLLSMLTIGCGKDNFSNKSIDELKSISEDGSTEILTEIPTVKSTEAPTVKPTEAPTVKPTEAPTVKPTEEPTTPPTEELLEEQLLAKEIIDSIITPSMSELEKVIKINSWMCDNIEYDYDNYYADTIPNEDYTALGALKNGLAVCSGYAYAFDLLAKTAGLDVIYVIGTANNGSGNGYQGHAWNQVKIEELWYNIDVTWNDGVVLDDFYGILTYEYFLVSDDNIYRNHKPNEYVEVNKCKNDYNRQEIAECINNNLMYENGLVFGENIEDVIKNIEELWRKGYKKVCVQCLGDFSIYELEDNMLMLYSDKRGIEYNGCDFMMLSLYEPDPFVSSYVIINTYEEYCEFLEEKYNNGEYEFIFAYNIYAILATSNECKYDVLACNSKYRLIKMELFEGMHKWWQDDLDFKN